MFINFNKKGKILTIKDCLLNKEATEYMITKSNIDFDKAFYWLKIYQGLENFTPKKILSFQTSYIKGAKFIYGPKHIKLSVYALFLLWELSTKYKFTDELIDADIFIFNLNISNNKIKAIGYIEKLGFACLDLTEYLDDDEELFNSVASIIKYSKINIEPDDNIILVDNPIDSKQVFYVEGTKQKIKSSKELLSKVNYTK